MTRESRSWRWRDRGLTGVGLPRKGNQKKGIVGWEDVQDTTEGTVEIQVEDDTLPDNLVECTITSHAPFVKCDRVADYRVAWAVFGG
ncbi:MAG: hypothetical protein ACLFV6_09445 [Spirulinaceae cyanobacterium]